MFELWKFITILSEYLNFWSFLGLAFSFNHLLKNVSILDFWKYHLITNIQDSIFITFFVLLGLRCFIHVNYLIALFLSQYLMNILTLRILYLAVCNALAIVFLIALFMSQYLMNIITLRILYLAVCNALTIVSK